MTRPPYLSRAALAAVFVLAACSAGNAPPGGAQDAASAPAMMDMAVSAPAAAPPPPPPPPGMEAATEGKVAVPNAGGAGGAPPVAGAMLAYTYNAGLTLPFEHVRLAMAGHEKACVDAGPTVCQVIGSSVAQPRDDEIAGALQLRARPDFAAGFVATLEGDAAKLKGRIEQSRQSEDLTRAIIDTEAQLRAKTTLRDRLQALLRDRPGRLSDLLETETALANVQQEIDAAQSYLGEMRQRVATSMIFLNYQTLTGPARGGAFVPLGEAANDFLGTLSTSLAGLITLVAMALPWLAVGGLLIWLGLFLLRRRLPRAAKSTTSGALNAAPERDAAP
jgi:hypothetical protein